MHGRALEQSDVDLWAFSPQSQQVLERFPGSYQLKSVARAVVLGMQWCGDAFFNADKTSDSIGPHNKEQNFFLTQLQRQEGGSEDIRNSPGCWWLPQGFVVFLSLLFSILPQAELVSAQPPSHSA